jgi:hypothetical protein
VRAAGLSGMDNREIAKAFSGHRFADAYPHLAQNVRWVLVGAEVATVRGG